MVYNAPKRDCTMYISEKKKPKQNKNNTKRRLLKYDLLKEKSGNRIELDNPFSFAVVNV